MRKGLERRRLRNFFPRQAAAAKRLRPLRRQRLPHDRFLLEQVDLVGAGGRRGATLAADVARDVLAGSARWRRTEAAKLLAGSRARSTAE